MDIDGLVKSADHLVEKAELTGNISFVTRSNSLRRTSNEKARNLRPWIASWKRSFRQ